MFHCYDDEYDAGVHPAIPISIVVTGDLCATCNACLAYAVEKLYLTREKGRVSVWNDRQFVTALDGLSDAVSHAMDG